MQQLPMLARDLTQALRAGLFLGMTGIDRSPWQVVADLEEENLTGLKRLSSTPISDYVQPMHLDGITVADDSTFLKKLMDSRNLPNDIKHGLPSLYSR